MSEAPPTDPLANSPFLERLNRRYPDWLPELERAGRLEHNNPPGSADIEGLIKALGLDPGLRQFRNREMFRICWREITGMAALEETMADLSRLAELCLEAAIASHQLLLEERFGTPRDAHGKAQQLLVLGLGKLGGGELNLSSDIDIILCFPATGNCDGARRLSNEQFFTRLARAVINSLSELTEDGFCFRVDTRLRPFGEAGPLVCSFSALEQYYQREGRDWERYALVKARPVAGDLEAGRALLRTLTPFVYRRYIDFGAVESLRTMLDAIRADAARRRRGNDVKRGPGGIREVEFLVQCVQLLRGGREPLLQTPSLLTALDAVQTLGLFPEERIHSLRSCYRFLRHIENAIQALHDQQTHEVPEGEDLERITRIMNFDTPELLLARLSEVRDAVSSALDDSFPRQHDEHGATQSQTADSDRNWRAHLDELPGASPGDFLDRLNRRALTERARARLDQFMPRLLDALRRGKPERPANELTLAGPSQHPTAPAPTDRPPDAPPQLPDDVLDDVLELVLAISQRSAYLALLVQNPPALDRMLDLFFASGWVAHTVIRHPALLDELLDPSLGRSLPDREMLEATLRRLTRSGEDEEKINVLAYQKLAQSLRIAVAELDGTITAERAEQKLTELAEVMLEAALDLSAQMLGRRHAQPGQSLGSDSGSGSGSGSGGLAIIAYGSLGAGDVSYNSDLDLVFLYPDTVDPGTEPETNPRSGKDNSGSTSPKLGHLAPETWFTRQVRRLLAIATTVTPAGRLYDIDTRLRPNGRSGLLVSPMAAFERYQKEKAWTWEWQALTRARFVAGNTSLASRFESLRVDVLCQPKDAEALRTEVSDMRARMRNQNPQNDQRTHNGSGGGDRFKHGPGGLLDIEFLAQLGVLENAAEYPALASATDTRDQLQLLGAQGWLTVGDSTVLIKAHQELTRARHLQALCRNGCETPPDQKHALEICSRFGLGDVDSS